MAIRDEHVNVQKISLESCSDENLMKFQRSEFTAFLSTATLLCHVSNTNWHRTGRQMHRIEDV